ncbi:DUF2934 domain-containing protein [Pseudomonas sp. Marseille-QA0332]
MMSVNEERIRVFAYQIWESEGKPEGQEERHWDMARKLAEAESLAPKATPRKPATRTRSTVDAKASDGKVAAQPKPASAGKAAAQPKPTSNGKASASAQKTAASPAEKPVATKKPRASKKPEAG